MIKPNSSTFSTQNPSKKQEMSRILSAAVINSHFRSLLLSDPVSAITRGYAGESFSLASNEKEKLGAIHASNLAEFAAQLSAI
jgi:hypothetical protein